jgi:hypothetical protein
VRWQVELKFKRDKSIAGLDMLPNFRDDTIRAWLLAKLVLCQMVRRLLDSSPASDAGACSRPGPSLPVSMPWQSTVTGWVLLRCGLLSIRLEHIALLLERLSIQFGEGFFVVRHHRINVPWKPMGRLRRCGTIDGSEVWEQQVKLRDDAGNKAALRAEHGSQKIQEEVSSFYLADEIAGTRRGMDIAIPAKAWRVFQTAQTEDVAKVLVDLAAKVDLSKFRRHPRGPKRPQPPRSFNKKPPHVFTARLLALCKTKRKDAP